MSLSINTENAAHAREHGINMSQVSEEALRSAVKAELERKWKVENREAIEGYNRWVEVNGLPLEKYRVW